MAGYVGTRGGRFDNPDGFLQQFSPAKAILAGLAILLAVCIALLLLHRYPCDVQVNQETKGVISSVDALVDLLESVERFLCRLEIYARIPPTPETDEVVIKIMVELLSTLALATKQLKRGQSSEYVPVDMLPY